MVQPVTGILQKIQTFLHGLITPPPPAKEEPDPFVFFEEIAWLHESERIRRDALTFWDANSHKKRLGQVVDLSVADKFVEKHTLVLSDVQLMRLNALAEHALGSTYTNVQRDKAFGPSASVSDDWIRTTGGPAHDNAPPRPVLTFVDPLENLYEAGLENHGLNGNDNGTFPHSDLYKVIIRKPLERKAKN